MGDIPVQYWVAGGLVLAGILIGIFRPRAKRPDYERAECACGWHGQVSRYAGRCPRCNEPLGEQRGRSKPYR